MCPISSPTQVMNRCVSIHFCIFQALAEPHKRQLYQAPVSKIVLASAIVSGFGGCLWDGYPRWGSLWMVLSSISALNFVSITPSMGILFPILRRNEEVRKILWSSFFLSFKASPVGACLVVTYVWTERH